MRIRISFPTPPAGNAPVYYGVGETIWDTIFELRNRPENPALGFNVPASPVLQKIHIGYPAVWGRAKFFCDGLNQTGAFVGPRVLEIAGVTCYVYSSNKRITASDLSISVGA